MSRGTKILWAVVVLLFVAAVTIWWRRHLPVSAPAPQAIPEITGQQPAAESVSDINPFASTTNPFDTPYENPF